MEHLLYLPGRQAGPLEMNAVVGIPALNGGSAVENPALLTDCFGFGAEISASPRCAQALRASLFSGTLATSATSWQSGRTASRSA